MYDNVDRLQDGFWTENELAEMAESVINPSRYDAVDKHICWYHILKDGEYTGVAMLLAVESIVDGQEAVNNSMESVGMSCAIGEYGDESVMNCVKVEALYRSLENYQYISKVKFSGHDKLFRYEEWMQKLV